MKSSKTVQIIYHTGNRKGQTIMIEGIEVQNIMEILGEITQEQLTNADLLVIEGDIVLEYEDFIVNRFSQTKIKRS